MPGRIYPSKIEVDFIMCRLQNAVYENNKEKIQEIINEAKEIVKRVEEYERETTY